VTPAANQAYWILTATVTALLAFYYLPIFAAVIRLRYTQPDTTRPFRRDRLRRDHVRRLRRVAAAADVTFVSDTVYVGAARPRPGLDDSVGSLSGRAPRRVAQIGARIGGTALNLLKRLPFGPLTLAMRCTNPSRPM